MKANEFVALSTLFMTILVCFILIEVFKGVGWLLSAVALIGWHLYCKKTLKS